MLSKFPLLLSTGIFNFIETTKIIKALALKLKFKVFLTGVAMRRVISNQCSVLFEQDKKAFPIQQPSNA